MFGMCALFMLVCLACQKQFAAILHCEQAGSHLYDDDPEAKENDQLLKSKDAGGDTATVTVVAK